MHNAQLVKPVAVTPHTMSRVPKHSASHAQHAPPLVTKHAPPSCPPAQSSQSFLQPGTGGACRAAGGGGPAARLGQQAADERERGRVVLGAQVQHGQARLDALPQECALLRARPLHLLLAHLQLRAGAQPRRHGHGNGCTRLRLCHASASARGWQRTRFSPRAPTPPAPCTPPAALRAVWRGQGDRGLARARARVPVAGSASTLAPPGSCRPPACLAASTGTRVDPNLCWCKHKLRCLYVSCPGVQRRKLPAFGAWPAQFDGGRCTKTLCELASCLLVRLSVCAEQHEVCWHSHRGTTC